MLLKLVKKNFLNKEHSFSYAFSNMYGMFQLSYISQDYKNK